MRGAGLIGAGRRWKRCGAIAFGFPLPASGERETVAKYDRPGKHSRHRGKSASETSNFEFLRSLCPDSNAKGSTLGRQGCVKGLP